MEFQNPENGYLAALMPAVSTANPAFRRFAFACESGGAYGLRL